MGFPAAAPATAGDGDDDVTNDDGDGAGEEAEVDVAAAAVAGREAAGFSRNRKTSSFSTRPSCVVGKVLGG